MTGIEWTTSTWNATTGCDRVSPGCDNCYALTMAARLKGMGSAKYQRDGDPATSGPGFGLTVHEDVLLLPLSWKKPRKIFVNSMSDSFHKDVPDAFIARMFGVMARTPQHTYQLLTKRHARMRSLLNSAEFRHEVQAAACGPVEWPLPNLHLGVSVENQKWADVRIPALLDTPAAVRWLSMEPLLGPVDLGRWMSPVDFPECWDDHAPSDECSRCIHPTWVVVGGESGPGARPMHPTWARSLRDQCASVGVPYFFKQWGAWAEVDDSAGWQARRGTDSLIRADGFTWPMVQPHGAEDGTEVLIRRVGKKTAGRMLDGREWSEYPVEASR